MKLTDDSDAPSMWEVIASKPRKKDRAMKQHRMKRAKEGPEAYEAAKANLIRIGILNPDGSGKVR